jgi:hypothetical protein
MNYAVGITHRDFRFSSITKGDLCLYFFRKGSVDFPSVAKATFALDIPVNIDSMQRINEICFHYRSGRVRV